MAKKRGAKLKGRQAYKQTRVPIDRSRGQILALLREYGAKGAQFSDNWQTGDIVLRFVVEIEGQDRSARVALNGGDNPRQAHRQLYYWVKSQLEAIVFGIVNVQDVFLAHFEVMLEDGSVATVGEIVAPQLGKVGGVKLLLEPEEKDIIDAEWEEKDVD